MISDQRKQYMDYKVGDMNTTHLREKQYECI